MSTPTNLTEFCQPGPYPVHYTFLIFVAALVMMLNIFVLSAMVASKKILKHNVVYKYVASCLVSAVFLCASTIFQVSIKSIDFTAYYSSYVLNNTTDSSTLMGFYSFSKSLLSGFFLAVQFNLASLLFCVSNNTVFVGRYFIPKKSNSQVDETDVAQTHTVFYKKTINIILIAWTVPILYVIPTAFGWSCVSYCRCLPGYRTYPTCIDEKNPMSCSKFLEPLSSSFFITTSCLWFVASFIILFMLWQTLKKFCRSQHVSESLKVSSSDDSPGKFNDENETDKTTSSKSIVNHATLKNEAVVTQEVEGRDVQINVDSPSALKPEKSNWSSPLTNPIVKLTVILSLSSILCFCPTVISMLLEATVSYQLDEMVFVIPVSLAYMYVISLPLIIMAYLPGIRNAVKSNLLKCPCLRTTTVVRSGGAQRRNCQPRSTAL